MSSNVSVINKIRGKEGKKDMKGKKENIEENKMGTMPVSKLVISMSFPMMISMTVQALYNVVDSIFVSRLSEHALTAVSMAFPIQNLMIAVVAGLAVGINSLLSRSLGEGNQEKVNSCADHGLFLVSIGYLIFLCTGLFFVHGFMVKQTNIPTIVQGGTIYLRICCICSFGLMGQMTFERLLQSTGRTIYTMITQGMGALINIILDPILIFGYFGLPKMGIAGAATATVIGQNAAWILAMFFHFTKNYEIHINFREFRPKMMIIKEILIVGVPSIIMQSIGSVMVLGMNLILMTFSSTAVAVFGVYFKLQSFVFMPIFGLNNGIIPIVAFNYGAGKKERLLKTIKVGICYAVGIMAVGLVIIQMIPGRLLMLFDASEMMLQIGVPALRIISLSFVFAGYCVILSGVFQALGNGIYSMMVSVARQLIVLLPVAFLFSRIGGLSMVWFAYPIAEIASVAVSTFFYRRINHHIIHYIR